MCQPAQRPAHFKVTIVVELLEEVLANAGNEEFNYVLVCDDLFWHIHEFDHSLHGYQNFLVLKKLKNFWVDELLDVILT